MQNTRIGRRSLLRALGAGALAAPLLKATRAFAGTTNPQRIIFVTTNHGTVYDNWSFNLPQLNITTAPYVDLALSGLAQSDFSRILSPLYAYRKDMLILDNLTLLGGILEPGANNAHWIGEAYALSGLPADPNTNLATGISIDQVIANNICKTTQMKSLPLSVYGGFLQSEYCYTSANNRIPGYGDPSAAFQAMFKSFVSDPAERQLLATHRRSVLDFVQAEHAAIRPKLSNADAQRLDAQLATVRDLETRLNAATLACTEPATVTENAGRPSDEMVANTTLGAAPVARYRSVADLQMRNAVAALACGFTNVATINFGQQVIDGFQDLSSADITGLDPHGDLAHNADDPTKAMYPVAHEGMTAYHQRHAQQVATLLSYLQAVPGLYESTMVVWVNELATGGHAMTQWPAVIIGGGGYFRTGRYVRYTPAPYIYGDDQNPLRKLQDEYVLNQNPTIPSDIMNGSHQNLLVSIANAMGVPMTTFGDTRFCNGPLANLV